MSYQEKCFSGSFKTRKNLETYLKPFGNPLIILEKLTGKPSVTPYKPLENNFFLRVGLKPLGNPLLKPSFAKAYPLIWGVSTRRATSALYFDMINETCN